MGLLDIIVEARLAPWDIQALIPIVEGAGGIVTNWQGGDAQAGGRILDCGNARVHEQAMALLQAAR